MTESASSLRADAERNRQRIIAAAIEVFGSQGTGAPLDEVARRAGVGAGTLYRRFPDRSALLEAVASACVTSLIDRVASARAEEPTAWLALVRSLEYGPESQMVSRFWKAAGEPPPQEFRARLGGELDTLSEMVGEVLKAAQEEGSVRTDIDLGDLILLHTALSQARQLNPDATDDAFARVYAIALDGLRPPHP